MKPTRWVAIGALVAAIGMIVAILVWSQRRETYNRRIVVGPNPVALILDNQTKRAFVLNRGALNNRNEPSGPGTVTVVNSETGEVVTTVQVGFEPKAAAVDYRTGRVFVTNRGFYDPGGLSPEPGTVTILDATSGQALRTVEVGIGPHVVKVDEQGGRVLVLNSGGRAERGSISILDSTSGIALRQIPVDGYPADIVVNSPAGVAFVANFLHDTVSVLDLNGMEVTKTVQVGHQLENEPGTLARLVLDERTAHLFALSFSYPPVFAGSGPNNGSLAMIDSRRAEILNTVVMTNATAMALDVKSRQVLVAGFENERGWLSALDVESGDLLWNAQVGKNIVDLGVDEEASKLYVLDYDNGAVSVLDTKDGQALCTLVVGAQPIAIAVESQTHRVFVVSAKDNSLSILASTC